MSSVPPLLTSHIPNSLSSKIDDIISLCTQYLRQAFSCLFTMKKTDPINGVLQPILYIEKTILRVSVKMNVFFCIHMKLHAQGSTKPPINYSFICAFLTNSIREILENGVFTRKHRKVNVNLQTSTLAKLYFMT